MRLPRIPVREPALLMEPPEAWIAAERNQRNKLARLMFESVELKDDRAAAIAPLPDFAPFFVLHCQQEEGRSKERKRRDSNPRSQP